MADAQSKLKPAALATSYRLIAELLLYPEERDEVRIAQGLAALGRAPGTVYRFLEAFVSDPSSRSVDEYVATLELSPPCPLYLGTYLFDEPKTCRGAGMSGRNSYMIELSNIYKHFGFELNGSELSDFLPLMVEFLAISLERAEMDRIGLRRSFLERYVQNGLEPLAKVLEKYDSPYGLLIKALQAALADDLALIGDQPAWTRPADQPDCAATCSVRLEIPPPKPGLQVNEVKP